MRDDLDKDGAPRLDDATDQAIRDSVPCFCGANDWRPIRAGGLRGYRCGRCGAVSSEAK